MPKRSVTLRSSIVFLAACALVVLIGSPQSWAGDIKLSGAEEVPAVSTSASGSGMINVADDHSVSGSVMTTGIQGTAAHIHMAAAGQNGPVIVPLKKDGDKYSVPEGSKLTDQQYEAYKAGNTYVNVHSAANPGGEIRAQLKP
jgi:hypothetical protein